MSTVGWVLILLGVLVFQRVLKGRAANLPGDVSDIMQAAISGDMAGVQEVLARSGDSQTATTVDLGEGKLVKRIGGVEGVVEAGTNAVSAAAVSLGKAAKGYRFGASGPDYYDCSGLMWKAALKAGVYTGGRFTTWTIGSNKAFGKVTTPVVGDFVVWPTHHMGVVTGTNQFYSAKSAKSGIGYATISTWRNGDPPVYMRAK